MAHAKQGRLKKDSKGLEAPECRDLLKLFKVVNIVIDRASRLHVALLIEKVATKFLFLDS